MMVWSTPPSTLKPVSCSFMLRKMSLGKTIPVKVSLERRKNKYDKKKKHVGRFISRD